MNRLKKLRGNQTKAYDQTIKLLSGGLKLDDRWGVSNSDPCIDCNQWSIWLRICSNEHTQSFFDLPYNFSLKIT